MLSDVNHKLGISRFVSTFVMLVYLRVLLFCHISADSPHTGELRNRQCHNIYRLQIRCISIFCNKYCTSTVSFTV
jgi:hypothetical protein